MIAEVDVIVMCL